MRGGERVEMSRHRLSKLQCGRGPTVRAPVIDERQEQEKDALHVTQAALEGFELARSELELRLVQQAIRACLCAIAATQACERGQGSEHVYEPLLSALAR